MPNLYLNRRRTWFQPTAQQERDTQAPIGEYEKSLALMKQRYPNETREWHLERLLKCGWPGAGSLPPSIIAYQIVSNRRDYGYYNEIL